MDMNGFGLIWIWISGYLAIWISGYLDIWIYGHVEHEYMNMWIYGYMAMWMYINDGRLLTGRGEGCCLLPPRPIIHPGFRV